jgi:hypothetical protein
MILLAVGLILNGAVLIWLGWYSYDSYRRNNLIRQRDSRVEELHGIVVHLDELLTMSAYMAAATGESQWEQRYRGFQPKLDAAIKEAAELSAESYRGKIPDRIEAAHTKRVEMENRAFDLVRQGRAEQARAILSSDEYERNRQISAQEIRSFHLRRRYMRLAELRSIIYHKKEVMTMAAQMAVTTGDPRWEHRYRRFEPRLDAAIKETIALAPDERSREAVAKTKAANTKLVEIKNRAFELVRQGRIEQARAILSSDEYKKQEQIYAEGMAEFVARLSETTKKAIASEQHRALQHVAAIILLVPLIIIGLFVVFYRMRKWRVALKESDRHRKETRDYLEKLLNYANAPIIVWDPLSRIIRFNNAFEQLTGYKADEVLGKELQMLFPEESRRESLDKIERTLGGEYWQSVEIPILRKEGGIRIALWNSANIHADDGTTLIATIAQGQDITKRKRNEEALRESEERLQQVVENGQEWIWEVNANGLFTYASPLVETLIGYKPEEIVGKVHFYDLFHPDDREKLKKTSLEVFTHKKPFRAFVNRNVHKDGRIVWLSTSGIPMLNKEGVLLGYRGVDTDITKRRQAEETLRESEEKYRLLVSGIKDVVFEIDKDGNWIYLSPVAKDMLGYEPEELQGKPVSEILQAEDVGKIVYNGGKHPEKIDFEVRFIRKDGKEIYTRCVGRPVLDDGGKLLAIKGTIRDTSERKQLEAQLRQAQKMEAVGLLAGGIAHDFRNQLTVIKGFGQMLLGQGLLSKNEQEEVQEILRAAERSTSLVSKLMVFSRKEMLQPKVINLAEAIREMGNSLPPVIGENIRLSIVPGDRQYHIKVDPSQFEQAIMNMVINARNAMPDGGELTVETSSVKLNAGFLEGHPGAKAGRYVTVTVTDTGCGMDEETMKRIFEPFFTTGRHGEGTGLGLSMVYGFVQQSEGIIEVDSKLNKGTTFRMYFPHVGKPPQAAAVSHPSEISQQGRETLLVVEDEEAVRQLVVASLRRNGYTVLEAGNASEALPLGEHYVGKIDMLITDVVMPGMNGVKLAGKIKAARPDINVLFITGYIGKGFMTPRMTFKKANLLLKPFDSKMLVNKVRKILDGASPQPPDHKPAKRDSEKLREPAP